MKPYRKDPIMNERQKRIFEVLKKVSDGEMYCVDIFENKVYLLIEGNLIAFIGPDFINMTDAEIEHFIEWKIED